MPKKNTPTKHPLEASLRKAVEARLKTIQRRDKTLVFRKRHGSAYSMSGDPDLYGVWRGLPFEIELKQPGKNLTVLQAARLQEWEAAGSHTFVVHSLSELEAALGKLHAALK